MPDHECDCPVCQHRKVLGELMPRPLFTASVTVEDEDRMVLAVFTENEWILDWQFIKAAANQPGIDVMMQVLCRVLLIARGKGLVELASMELALAGCGGRPN